MLATFSISNNHLVCGTPASPAAHTGAHLLSQRRTGLLYIPIPGCSPAVGRGDRWWWELGGGVSGWCLEGTSCIEGRMLAASPLWG